MNKKTQNGWGWKEALEAILNQMASREARHKQDHVEQAARDHVQVPFEDLQG